MNDPLPQRVYGALRRPDLWRVGSDDVGHEEFDGTDLQAAFDELNSWQDALIAEWHEANGPTVAYLGPTLEIRPVWVSDPRLVADRDECEACDSTRRVAGEPCAACNPAAPLNVQLEAHIRELQDLYVGAESDLASAVERLTAAKDALRSYQYGNASPELAEEIADELDELLAELEVPGHG